VNEKASPDALAAPLANAPLLVVFYDEGVYRGMAQATTNVDGVFEVDLGALLDDYGISDRNGMEVHVRIGNDTTHDAVTVVLDSTRLDSVTNMEEIVLLQR